MPRGHACSIHARSSALSTVRFGIPALSASRLRSAHRFQLAGPMPRGHARSIHARSSALSTARFGIPAFNASRLRSAHRFQLAGPMPRGHARSIHARSSVPSTVKSGASAQSPLAISSTLGFSGPAAPVVVSAIATHPPRRMAPSAAERAKVPALILETSWLSTRQVLLLTDLKRTTAEFVGTISSHSSIQAPEEQDAENVNDPTKRRGVF